MAEEKANVFEKLLKSGIDTGFGIGERKKMILVMLYDGKSKYMSQLLRNLTKIFPNEKWNPVSLNSNVEYLEEEMGFVEKFDQDYKIYVKITNGGKFYLRLLKKTEDFWFKECKKMGLENEDSSDNNGNDD